MADRCTSCSLDPASMPLVTDLGFYEPSIQDWYFGSTVGASAAEWSYDRFYRLSEFTIWTITLSGEIYILETQFTMDTYGSQTGWEQF